MNRSEQILKGDLTQRLQRRTTESEKPKIINLVILCSFLPFSAPLRLRGLVDLVFSTQVVHELAAKIPLSG